MNRPIGSFISPQTPDNHVVMSSVLTDAGIGQRHNLTPKQLEKHKRELSKMKLTDILFSYPDGPRYDLVLNMVATAR